jgi:ubiquinone/menaquinone biosynthesis C-methylase UbiE
VPIDVADPANRRTYSGRAADRSWHEAMAGWIDPRGRTVADVGCGGGVHAHARLGLGLGAARAIGIDSSEPLLGAARETGERPGLSLVAGDAAATGLAEGGADGVFERALVHHLTDLGPVAAEARSGCWRRAAATSSRTGWPRT